MEIDQVNLKSLSTTKGDEILETIGIAGNKGDAAGFLKQLLGELEKLKGKSGEEGDIDTEEQLADLVGKILPHKETDLPVTSEIREHMEKDLLSEEQIADIPILTSLSDPLVPEQIEKIIRQLAGSSDGENSAFIDSATAVGIGDTESDSAFDYQLARRTEQVHESDFIAAADSGIDVDNEKISNAMAQQVGLVQKSETKIDGEKTTTLDGKPITDRLVESTGYKNSESGFTKDGESRSNMANSSDEGDLPDKIFVQNSEVSATPKVAAHLLSGVPGVVPAPVNNQAVAGNSIQPTIQSPLGQQGWDQEFGEQVAWMTRNSLHTAELRLNPRHLGPVEVRIQINQDQAEIVFSSQHSVVREAIEAALPKLRETFMAQQIELRDVNVSEQTFSERRDFQEQKGERPYAGMLSDEESTGDMDSREETVMQDEMNKGLVSYYV